MAAHSARFFNDLDFFAPEIANFRSPSGVSLGSEGSRGVSRGGRVWIVSRKGSDFQGNFRNPVFLRGVRFPMEFLEICARGKSGCVLTAFRSGHTALRSGRGGGLPVGARAYGLPVGTFPCGHTGTRARAVRAGAESARALGVRRVSERTPSGHPSRKRALAATMAT